MSTVRVGLRIRPLLANKEQYQSLSIHDYDATSVTLKGQHKFTYDHVFGPDMTQEQLYTETAAPMMKNILEGYNVTIMAYGQTGSGKTFTMGTSDNQSNDVSCQGLIPRFVSDLFENIQSNATNEGDYRESKVKVSFLEIYGEDVYDLIGAHTKSIDRPSLPVREDESGHVFIQGLHETEVTTASAALEQLTIGSRNRITGSTAMNAGSSRSHAVFSVTVQQSIRPAATRPASAGTINDDNFDAQSITSTLTFVDLAGSERIKRTGAEGQRMKEGIQINSGLFNLGQVINALADEQKIKQGIKAAHVPYRNSKLTHLLKDALGGNSQTLFLACVSPAESNESETLSTLNYAKQARNIQNKPVQNVDKTQMEIRRLKLALRTWISTAVSLKFGLDASQLPPPPSTASVLSPVRVKPGESGGSNNNADIWSRSDVQDYIASVGANIDAQMEKGCQTTPRKIRLSVLCAPLSNLSTTTVANIHSHSISKPKTVANHAFDTENGSGVDASGEDVNALTMQLKEHLGECKDPEETARLVARMMEIVRQEKDSLLLQQGDHDDEDGIAEALAGPQGVQLEEVEQAIEEKEEILNKLMETVKGYSTMKADFEKLVDTIGELETERKDLEAELEKVKSQQQQLGSASANPLAVEKLKERYNKVKDELSRMRSEKSNKENAYKLMQRESKQCDALQKELQKLKDSKVSLQRLQRSQATQFQKMKRDNASKVLSLKKVDLKKQRMLNSMKNELAKKDRVIGNKDKEITRIQSKLRACEDHVTQLLKIQNRNRTRMLQGPASSSSTSVPVLPSGSSRSSIAVSSRSSMLGASAQLSSLSAIELVRHNGLLPANEVEHLVSSKALLDGLVGERLEKHRAKLAYDRAVSTLKDIQKQLAVETSRLAHETANRNDILSTLATLLSLDREEVEACLADFDDVANAAVQAQRHLLQCADDRLVETEASIDALQREADLATADLETAVTANTNSNGNTSSSSEVWEELGREAITGLSLPQLQALSWDLLGEKCDALEQLAYLNCETQRLQDQCDASSEAVALLRSQVALTRQELQNGLAAAERQRVQDVWDVVTASDQNKNKVDAAAWQRISALEKEATERSNELLVVMEQQQAMQSKLEAAEKAVLALQMKIEVIRDCGISNDSNSSGTNSSSSEDSEDEWSQLSRVWDELGVDLAGRAAVRDDLQREARAVRQRVLQATLARRSQTAEAAKSASETCRKLHLVLSDQSLQPQEEGTTQPLLTSLDSASQCKTRLMAVFSARHKQALDLQTRLVALTQEMRLEVDSKGEVSPALQNLAHLPLGHPNSAASSKFISDDSHNFAVESVLDTLSTAGASLSGEELKRWETDVRQLNVLRAQISGKLAALLEKTRSLAVGDLQMSLSHVSELRAVGDQALAVGGCHGDVDSDRDVDRVTAPIMAVAVDLLLSDSSTHTQDQSYGSMRAPPGSAKVLAAMERLQMMLEALKVSRQTVVAHVTTFNELLRVYLEPHEIQGDADVDNKAVLGRSHIDALFVRACAAVRPHAEWVAHRRAALLQSLLALQELTGVNNNISSGSRTGTVTPQNIAQSNALTVSASDQIEALMSRVASSSNNYSLQFDEIDNLVDELDGLCMFLEEDFLKHHVAQLTGHWHNNSNQDSHRGKPQLKQAIVMLAERQRIDGIAEGIREIVKYDGLLAKQVVDMEEFELHSKQDRAKLLSGNSKALIEEERFRKASKRKYEQLSEKIVSSYGQLQTLLTSVSLSKPNLSISTAGVVMQSSQTHVPFASARPVPATPVSHGGAMDAQLNLEISIDCAAFLSSQAQSLVRGKFKEKVELMHLKLDTHGTRRWSGEPPLAGSSGTENVKDDHMNINQMPHPSPASTCISAGTSSTSSTSSAQMQHPLASLKYALTPGRGHGHGHGHGHDRDGSTVTRTASPTPISRSQARPLSPVRR